MMKRFFTPPCLSLCLLTLFFANIQQLSACDVGESELMIDIDSPWGFGVEWTVTDEIGTVYGSGDEDGGTVCFPEGLPIYFTIDGYFYTGDNLQLLLDGTLFIELTSGDVDGDELQIPINFPTGSSCYAAESILEGSFTAPNPDFWYEFVPALTGTYRVTTCDLGNTCNTKLWIYNKCIDLVPTELAEGTYSYNDDACGELAEINVILVGGDTYYIRVGDVLDFCEGSPIYWSLSYGGEPIGCTDMYACNYDPLAMEDDGSCIFPGNPDCPTGPDLVMDPSFFDGEVGGWGADFSLATINADDAYGSCYLGEGALNGTGMRTVLQFGVRINNIGDEDYHIGSVGESPYLVYDPCHGHYHYVDYGEYLLYDSLGVEIPAGHKNGYAVMDLCGIGGGYGGSDMGISAGCYDEYGKGTGGQWVDITDVPDGTYTMVARVNWENHPDIDGRIEINLANNWISACLKITHDIDGEIIAEIVDDCATYLDCYGEIWGTAEMDCEGNCNGWHHVGDLNEDSTRTTNDVDLYINHILENTIIAEMCNDANADGDIDVVDAALVMGCANEALGYTHETDLCDLPQALMNTSDTVTYSIGALNPDFNYLDIYSLNPSARVMGAQFTMQGITIDSVVNLCPETFGENFQITFTDDEVIVLGMNEVAYQIHFEPIPTFRIFYSAAYPTDICIKHFTAAVNENFEEVVTAFDATCFTVTVTGVEEMVSNPFQVKIQPNPFSESAVLHFENESNKEFVLEVSDMNGNLIETKSTSSNTFSINGTGLSAGVYLYRLTGVDGSQKGKFIIQ